VDEDPALNSTDKPLSGANICSLSVTYAANQNEKIFCLHTDTKFIRNAAVAARYPISLIATHGIKTLV